MATQPAVELAHGIAAQPITLVNHAYASMVAHVAILTGAANPSTATRLAAGGAAARWACSDGFSGSDDWQVGRASVNEQEGSYGVPLNGCWSWRHTAPFGGSVFLIRYRLT